MRIFITGGTGFIGSHVIKKLAGHDILALSSNTQNNFSNSKNLSLLKGNLANLSDWKKKVRDFKPDAAVHIAWEGIPDYGIEMSLKNLQYGLSLYEFLTEIKCKNILTTGSCWEYGGQKGKLSEDMPVKPFNAFTASKNSLNFLGWEIAKKNNVNFIWTRLFYIYGPGQKGQSLIPYLIDCVKNGKTPEIKNPLAKNDFAYVEDVADAISKILINCKESTTYNIGSGKLTSVQKIIDIIFKEFSGNESTRDLMVGVSSLGRISSDSRKPATLQSGFYRDKQFRKKQARQTDTLSSFYADISKIKKEVDWKPETNIEQGIKKTIAYSLEQ